MAAVSTGLLLAASFPPLEIKEAGWFALVPFLLAAAKVDPRRSARLGFLAGAVFWLFSIHWLTHVTIVGWITLALYCALYVMPFTVIAAWWIRRWGTGGIARNIALMGVLALSWVGLEYLRSTLFTGFPWNPLGVSQYRNLTIIQAAEWGGVYAVSAVMVWVNAAIALTILRHLELRGRIRLRPHPELIAGLLVWVGVHAYGWSTFRAPVPAGVPFRAALIQPNIPQVEKWTAEFVTAIYTRLQSLTEAAVRVGPPDLVIWPETAVPDDIRDSAPSYTLVYELARLGVPILVGSMDAAWTDEEGPVYYNSSFLFDTAGSIVQGYDKQHLVIFGEYVPFRRALPFMKAMTPIQESFSAGSTATIFRVEGNAAPFSVLICFEDTVARLARKAVRNGARLLVNQTNDAWFDPSSGSRQHMTHCVFRCVENRVPAFRATNTGVTCAIDRFGRVYDELLDDKGRTLIAGFRITEADVPPADLRLTFYTRHGDVLGILGVAVMVVMLVVSRIPGGRIED
ncbi:MAG: apolipoprotein N-acyltransferase [Kiritimatiellae bacterium]|nr:apolipoprotein N-acyltransferase [Kiritimatiellia bacterium]